MFPELVYAGNISKRIEAVGYFRRIISAENLWGSSGEAAGDAPRNADQAQAIARSTFAAILLVPYYAILTYLRIKNRRAHAAQAHR